MKIELCDRYGFRKPDLKNPILIDDTELSKNKHGQLLVSFATRNHKYLDVDYGSLHSHVPGKHCEHGMARGIDISTQEQYRPEDWESDKPEDSVTLYLIPESEEERELLCGRACILPTKWAYQICIVPFGDFYP